MTYIIDNQMHKRKINELLFIGTSFNVSVAGFELVGL